MHRVLSLAALCGLAVALSCENDSRVTSPRSPSGPSKIILDGAHGGNKDFFFLPPMVPPPLNNPDFELGKFNNALRPSLTIEICELDLALPASHNAQGLPTDVAPCAAG